MRLLVRMAATGPPAEEAAVLGFQKAPAVPAMPPVLGRAQTALPMAWSSARRRGQGAPRERAGRRQQV